MVQCIMVAQLNSLPNVFKTSKFMEDLENVFVLLQFYRKQKYKSKIWLSKNINFCPKHHHYKNFKEIVGSSQGPLLKK